MKIYCTTIEIFPPKLVDVVELFMKELRTLGVTQHWFYKVSSPQATSSSYFMNVKVSTPSYYKKRNFVVMIYNTILYLGYDIKYMYDEVRKGADLILVRDKYFSTIPAWIISRIYSKKFVVWCSYPFPEHDWELAKMVNWKRATFLRARSIVGKYLFYKWAMNRSDHVFVQSEQMKDDLISHNIPTKKMTPVPMGVASDIFNRISEYSKIKVVPGRVIYLGTLNRVRRLNFIIQSFADVSKNVKYSSLLIVGEGVDPSDRRELEKEVVRLKLEDKVTFTGFVPIEKGWEYLSSSEVCLSPFFPTKVLRSTSPTKLIEYLAFGKPVVANDHPEQAVVLKESGAGICVPWEKIAFSHAIEQLLRDPENARIVGANGPIWVKNNRMYDHIAGQVYKRLKKIISNEIEEFSER